MLASDALWYRRIRSFGRLLRARESGNNDHVVDTFGDRFTLHNIVLNRENVGQVLQCIVQFQRGVDSILGDGTHQEGHIANNVSCGAPHAVALDPVPRAIALWSSRLVH